MIRILLFVFFTGCVTIPSAPPPSQPADSDVDKIVAASSCATYRWNDRGVAPKAYINGMRKMFLHEACRGNSDEVKSAMLRPLGSTSTDALAFYGLPATLPNLFALSTGLGMRESSGKYCEGYDTTAPNQTSTTAEAGLFQMSANALPSSSAATNVVKKYSGSSSGCELAAFSSGVSCKPQSIVGSGPGAEYQKTAKTCPAAAVESSLIVMRVLRRHWGPINRKEAEVVPACLKMYQDLLSSVQSNPSVCKTL